MNRSDNFVGKENFTETTLNNPLTVNGDYHPFYSVSPADHIWDDMNKDGGYRKIGRRTHNGYPQSQR